MRRMLKTLLTYGLGVYTGLYVAQNYEVDRVDQPKVLFDKFVKYIEDLTSGKKK